MIARVLIVPAPGDPGKLLAEGPCGARLPVASRRWWCERDEAGALGPVLYGRWESGWRYDGQHASRALVLVWAGAVVPEGCDRAWRVLWRSSGKIAVPPDEWSLGAACNLARACEAAGLGTAVIEEVPDAAE